KSIPNARANEIKKICGVTGDIFDPPSKYFTNPNFERATIPEIQQLLGVTSATNQTYKPFPPVLFPGLKEDKLLKTVFGNWELLARILKASLRGVTSLHQGSSSGGAHTNSLNVTIIDNLSISLRVLLQAIFLLLPDTEFSGSGLGKKLNISYKNLFYNYKKVLITKWATRCIVSIVANINHYVFKAAKGPAFDSAAQQDHTDAIDRALAALDMDSDSDDQSNLSALSSATLPVADPEPDIAAVTLSTTVKDSQPEAFDVVPEAADIDPQVAEVIEDAGGSTSG
ncbi:hypothetical protein DFH29DRAFT_815778, partial [Suillus ampliporus]